MIYLDNAATTLIKPPAVAQAVAEAIGTLGNASRGAGRPAMRALQTMYETRELLDELFHAGGPEQIAFTANATQSLNQAIKGVVQPGDRVVTTVLEHNSVLRPLYELEKKGVVLEIIGCRSDDRAAPEVRRDLPDAEAVPEVRGGSPDGKAASRVHGCLDYDALRRAIVPGVKAVVCTHASNLTGNRIDIARVGAWCRSAGALLIVDAAQTAGSIDIDMIRDHIDILCFSGHKGLMGPQGTGGICVRKGVHLPPLLTGGSGIRTYDRAHPTEMPEALEAGTQNTHGIAGLRAALLAIRGIGLDEIQRREILAARTFYEAVRKVPGIEIYGDFSDWNRAAIVSLNLAGMDSWEVSDFLSSKYEIETRCGGHCAPLMHEALGTRERGAVRFSFSCFTTVQEAICAANAVRAIAEEE